MRLSGRGVLSFPALLMLCAIYVPAVVSAGEVKPFVIVGAAFGGDTLVETTTEVLDAGGLWYFGGGVLFEPEDSDLMYQLSAGYKFDSIDFTGPSGSSSVNVLPLDAVVFYKLDKVRIGAGLAYYLNPQSEFCVDGSGCLQANFDDAIGLVMELRIQTGGKVFWGGRYTKVDYEIGSSSFDASSARVHVGFAF